MSHLNVIGSVEERSRIRESDPTTAIFASPGVFDPSVPESIRRQIRAPSTQEAISTIQARGSPTGTTNTSTGRTGGGGTIVQQDTKVNGTRFFQAIPSEEEAALGARISDRDLANIFGELERQRAEVELGLRTSKSFVDLERLSSEQIIARARREGDLPPVPSASTLGSNATLLAIAAVGIALAVGIGSK